MLARKLTSGEQKKEANRKEEEQRGREERRDMRVGENRTVKVVRGKRERVV